MLLLVLASLLWSVSFALIGRSGIDPDVLAAARLALAALLFSPVLLQERVQPRRALALMGVGALQFGLMYVLVMRAYAHLAGHEVALLTITTPVLVVLAGGLFAKRGPRLGDARAWCAASVAVAAAYTLRAGGARVESEGGFWTGVALVQGANLAWAAGQVLYARIEPSAGGGSTARFGWLYVGAALVAGGWAAGHVGRADLALDRGQILTLLYLGLVPSGVAFFLWNRGATQVGIGTLAVMNNLKVPLAVAVALAPPFNEPADLPSLLASAALLAAALWIARPRR
ncbi:MAG: EamA family transporter [Planctomycetota bacterium]|nr:EamA family transporter [Planctomycetota bacterium]